MIWNKLLAVNELRCSSPAAGKSHPCWTRAFNAPQGTGTVQLRCGRDGAEQPLPGEAPGSHSSVFRFGLSLPWLKMLEEQRLSSELQGGWSCSPKGCQCSVHVERGQGLFVQHSSPRRCWQCLCWSGSLSLPPHSGCRRSRGQGQLEAAEHLAVALRDGAQAGGHRGSAQTRAPARGFPGGETAGETRPEHQPAPVCVCRGLPLGVLRIARGCQPTQHQTNLNWCKY